MRRICHQSGRTRERPVGELNQNKRQIESGCNGERGSRTTFGHLLYAMTVAAMAVAAMAMPTVARLMAGVGNGLTKGRSIVFPFVSMPVPVMLDVDLHCH
jgi:hypothetical protein